ncbi:hypothetical protein P2H44_14710 [Albimonas sp. CAU 1670]|nr:hypothetical protein [Albimonas sp. CAU 1670]
MKKRRHFLERFKRQAVERALESQPLLPEAEDLGRHETVLR